MSGEAPSPPCAGARDERCHSEPGMCACFDTPLPAEHPLEVLRWFVGDDEEGNDALRAVEQLEQVARSLLELAEKDRGGGYPETNRSEEWYTHRDYARAALALFDRKEQTP